MAMAQIHVRESNSEVLIFIDKNMGDRLHALIEAARLLQIEVIREQSTYKRDIDRAADRDKLPPSKGANG